MFALGIFSLLYPRFHWLPRVPLLFLTFIPIISLRGCLVSVILDTLLEIISKSAHCGTSASQTCSSAEAPHYKLSFEIVSKDEGRLFLENTCENQLETLPWRGQDMKLMRRTRCLKKAG
jgi:hypothetical protein